MIFFKNTMPKKEGDLEWFFSNPLCVIAEVEAKRLTKRRFPDRCNVHGDSKAVIGLEFTEGGPSYTILEVCCDSYRQDLEQLTLRIRQEK